MESQRIIWTALPNGQQSGGVGRVSVHVSPRLMSTSGAVSLPLSDWPDWVAWPSTKIGWAVQIDALPAVQATVVSPNRDASLWARLFNSSTPVIPYSYTSLASRRIHSYPTGYVRQYFQSLYAEMAAAVASNSKLPVDWPNVDTLIGPANGGIYIGLPLTTELERSVDDDVAALYDNRFNVALPADQARPATDLWQAKQFLDPRVVPSKAYTEPAPKPPAKRKPYPRPKPPDIDFHQMVSMLGEYPYLERLFGLVFDLEFALPASLPPVVDLSVIPTWTSKQPRGSPPTKVTFDVGPVTSTIVSGLSAQPRSASPELLDGELRLQDPDAAGNPEYNLVEADLDGATLKTLNFVQGIYNANFAQPSFDTPTSYALPSLRSAGLSLTRTGNTLELKVSLQNSDALNAAAESDPVPLIRLQAEDVTRGYRIDVFDEVTDRWYQLCARTAATRKPAPGGYAVGSPPVVVPIPNGDEGWVQLAPTSSSSSSSDTYLTESLMRWAGWSLVAPRPGKHLSEDPHKGLEGDDANPPTGTFPLQVAYAATPGTLPVLRFGRTYRFRARAVDLAGNSVAFSPAPTPGSTTMSNPATYARLEPVATPMVIPRTPRTPGEHLELLVIRSEGTGPYDPTKIPTNERHVMAPGTSEELAEAHGAFDKTGRPQKGDYGEIAKRAGLTYSTPSVLSSLGGALDPNSNDAPYYDTHSLAVPYLPDVLARGAALQYLPGTSVSAPRSTCRSRSPASGRRRGRSAWWCTPAPARRRSTPPPRGGRSTSTPTGRRSRPSGSARTSRRRTSSRWGCGGGCSSSGSRRTPSSSRRS